MQNFPHYTTQQKWNHWLTALLIFAVIILPMFKISLSHWLGGMTNVYMLHKSLGTLVLFFTFWRIFFIIKQGVPNTLPKTKKLQRALAKSLQGCIYLLLILLPLSGYLMSSRSLNFFNFINIPAMPLPNYGYVFFHSVHIYGSYLLMVLILMHILAAIYHHWWIKDNVVRSMV